MNKKRQIDALRNRVDTDPNPHIKDLCQSLISAIVWGTIGNRAYRKVKDDSNLRLRLLNDWQTWIRLTHHERCRYANLAATL